MTVYFIGAGPGAADLITVRGQRVIESSAVCLYAGSLVPDELLTHCPEGARLVDTARMNLDEITAELVAAHGRGEDVARLHSGDTAIYSAMAEQMRRLDGAEVPYEVVPGVPSFSAAAAILGRELTVPGVSQSVVISRVSTLSTSMPPGEDLATLGRSGATLVLLLAAAQIDTIVAELTPNYGPDCPVAVVAYATRPGEQVVRATVSTIAPALKDAGITKTAVIIVGKVLAADAFPDSYLYSVARERCDH